MLSDAQRTNPRSLSNALSAQSSSIPSARGLSDYVTWWGQLLAHDMGLTATTNGSAINGSAPIAILDAGDPLGPNPIPVTRSNFVIGGPFGPVRQQLNEVTSYVDASTVYGSLASRGAALRTDGGTGAKLLTSAGNLLPFNTLGLPNENRGPLPANQLLVAGDIRANENPGLLSLHTIFMREHNRLVDVIAASQPGLSAEEQYQLARKIVGAQFQRVTYDEFLPALIGANAAPRAADYQYNPLVRPDTTQSFSHAAFRFGHSIASQATPLVDNQGLGLGAIGLLNGSFNPTVLTQDPTALERILKGGATQTSQEMDTRIISELRNVLFGPPGSGGTDLAAVDIQRGRDHGIPDYNFLRVSYGLPSYANFGQITSDAALAQGLSDAYQGNLSNVDPWLGGLAESHVAGASVGPLFLTIIAQQFTRSRDADRLFFLSDAAGLYTGGVLRPEIAAIIELDQVRLADIIRRNTDLTNIQDNVFFATRFVRSGDFNGDTVWNCGDVDALVAEIVGGQATSAFDLNGDTLVDSDDLTAWLVEAGFRNLPSGNPFLLGDANLDGVVDGTDFGIWNTHKFTSTAAWCLGDFNADGATDGSDFGLWNASKFQSALRPVPEPASWIALVIALFLIGSCARALPPFHPVLRGRVPVRREG